MTDDTLSLFDGKGHIRDLSSDADVAALEALDASKRVAAFACIKAVKASEAGERRVEEARRAVHAAMDAHSAAVMAGTVTPRDAVTGVAISTPRAGASIDPAVRNAQHVAALQAASAANRPGYVAPKRPKTKATLTVAEKAHADLETAQAELRMAIRDQEALAAVAGVATNEWRTAINVGVYTWDPTLPEHIARSKAQAKLHRDHVAAENAERAARVARGEPAEPPKVEPNFQSAFDAKRARMPRVVRPLIHR
jgi:hypothetical protein